MILRNWVCHICFEIYFLRIKYFQISLYQQAKSDIFKKANSNPLAPSGSVSLFPVKLLLYLFPFFFHRSHRYSWIISYVPSFSITPITPFLLFLSFSFSPFLIIRAFLWDHVRAQMIIKRVSSSFFFSSFFPRNTGIFKEIKVILKLGNKQENKQK